DTGATLGVERPFWNNHVKLRLQKHFRYAMPFAYVGEKDPRLGAVLLGYPEFVAELDLRDDPISPRSGIFVSTRTEAALYVGALDVRLVPEVRGYVPLGPVVLAT